MGVDVHRLRAVPRVPAVPVLPELLAAVLRWSSLRAERRFPAHCGLFPAGIVPQLVPALVSIRVRHVPAGGLLMFARGLDSEFARDVRAGLTRGSQKTLPCRYLYDDVGSALFDAITCLPEYGLTRADARVIETHAPDLIELMPANTLVVELGSGSGLKTRPILE